MNCPCGLMHVTEMPTEGQNIMREKNTDGENGSLPMAKHFVKTETSYHVQRCVTIKKYPRAFFLLQTTF